MPAMPAIPAMPAMPAMPARRTLTGYVNTGYLNICYRYRACQLWSLTEPLDMTKPLYN
jgi:acetoacetate decarboxylase